MAEKSQPTVSRFESLPISSKTKREEKTGEDPATRSGGGQLTAKVKPLVVVKEATLAMDAGLLTLPVTLPASSGSQVIKNAGQCCMRPK